jgi:hypothetical protein
MSACHHCLPKLARPGRGQLRGAAVQRIGARETSAHEFSTNCALAIGHLGDARQGVMAQRAAPLRELLIRDTIADTGAPRARSSTPSVIYRTRQMT